MLKGSGYRYLQCKLACLDASDTELFLYAMSDCFSLLFDMAYFLRYWSAYPKKVLALEYKQQQGWLAQLDEALVIEQSLQEQGHHGSTD